MATGVAVAISGRQVVDESNLDDTTARKPMLNKSATKSRRGSQPPDKDGMIQLGAMDKEKGEGRRPRAKSGMLAQGRNKQESYGSEGYGGDTKHDNRCHSDDEHDGFAGGGGKMLRGGKPEIKRTKTIGKMKPMSDSEDDSQRKKRNRGYR